jgi:hypothetical protein
MESMDFLGTKMVIPLMALMDYKKITKLFLLITVENVPLNLDVVNGRDIILILRQKHEFKRIYFTHE